MRIILVKAAFAAIVLAVFLIRPIHIIAQSTSLCDIDITQDEIIDLSDYTLIAINFLRTTFSNPRIDINKDGIVDLSDYILVASNFLKPTGQCSTQDPTPPPIVNLLNNGDFENNLTGWSSGSGGSAVTSPVKSGSKSLKISSGGTSYVQGVNVQVGKNYVLTGWFRWAQMSESDWGFEEFGAKDATGPENRVTDMHKLYNQNQWQKLAVAITPTTNRVDVKLGVFGPETNVELYFDDLKFFEKTGNVSPIIDPQANITTGAAPLTVNFTANSEDYDGAVVVHQWQFGDGGESRDVNPSHTFATPGNYTVALSAYDNDSGTTSKTLSINVTGAASSTVNINSPSSSETFSTSSSTLALSGVASSPTAQIKSVVWDNINNGDAGAISITQGSSVNWSAGNINLKPGKNEILVTATDTNNKASTDKIVITRNISNPSISNVSVNTTSPRVYEKYEATFNVSTVADQPMFMYDPNPPVGAERYNGVTVEGIITLPNGQKVTHPAFYNTNSSFSGSKYSLTNTNNWKLRYSPQVQGTHQVSLRVTDASGTATTNVGSFTASAAVKPGFIQVSAQDSRYFEYSNGTLHWPMGMTWNGASGTSPDGINLANSVMNYDRPWMGGSGAYSTNWARWKSSAEQHGNEGITSHLSFTEHYPSSELSQYIYYPQGFRMWISCWLDDNFCATITSGRTYQVKIRAKVANVTGPRVSGKPYGLTIKRHGFSGFGTPDEFDAAMSSRPALLPHLNGTTAWHTVISTFTANSNDGDFSVYLENVTGGQAYIDEFSVREVLSGGSLGPEQIRNSKADLHTYVEQRPMAYFDSQVTAGEQNEINLRFVVHDKNDWIQNHLHAASGAFVSSGDGYYQPENTKATWLQKQWWRYLVARLGYSTAVFGWELNNEGPPDNGTGTHARHTQLFGKWMHDLDAHPHLSNTSFWCCWEPDFWKDKVKFPDVDFGDIHRYADANDEVQLHLDDALPVIQANIGRPVVMGERGINNMTSGNTTGVWYHNLLWSQLHYSALFEIGYWYPAHVNGFFREAHAAPFYNFVKDLDLNKGGYTDLQGTLNTNGLRAIGQKNITKGTAHIWFQNINYTWNKVFTSGLPSPVTGTVTFKMSPNTTYNVTYYNTYTGQVESIAAEVADSQGNLRVSSGNINQDVAVKINKI